MMHGMQALRDKLWYATDVRNSGIYEEAKNVTVALKAMGQPTKNPGANSRAPSRIRHTSKTPASKVLPRTEAQALSTIAASPYHGGPSKLADEQAELTSKWLTQSGIENFCSGEERIHRFCLEIEKCINKLVGEGILDGPVLWCSGLYVREKAILERERQRGDLLYTDFETPGLNSGKGAPHDPRSAFCQTNLTRLPVPQDLRAMSYNGGWQQSLDSTSWSTVRSTSTTSAGEVFESSNPFSGIDVSTTFWSPFLTQRQPPPGGGLRPASLSMNSGGAHFYDSRGGQEHKIAFLSNLKQTLTGLLLSDLGSTVFSRGSETDVWLASALGQECIEQLEGQGRHSKGSVSRKSASNAESNKSSSFDVPEEQTIDRADTPLPHFTLLDSQPASTHPGPLDDLNPHTKGVSGEGNSSRNNFPYNDAFRHMLHKFATHPKPSSKLQALYELELMIIAYLTSDFLEGSHSARSLTSAARQPSEPSLFAQLGSREASVADSRLPELKHITESRKLESVQTTTPHAESSATPSSFHSSTSRRPYVGPPSTDQIIEVLQDLFRSVDARPRTLFRDLQYIASFVPAQLLDKTAHGKAFWDAGLAALSLKRDVCEIMVEMADGIVAYHTSNRGHSQVSSTAQRQRDAAISRATSKSNTSPTTAGANSDAMSRYSMSDAAYLLQIAAKEGDCVAQRELATFYLTHPELLPRVMLPLTRPRDVFKAELESLWRRNEDPTRCDPMTMCVAQHWMEASSKGGDSLANKYLRAKDEIEKIP
ncbi:hypothetical protein LTR60_002412 [Cryomyces antarcticus]|nr:hypothetical protein LTR60_002412 [Cryomyces antarcticus]